MPVLIQNQSDTDHILETFLIHIKGTDGMQRIEPTTRLINRLADEIGRELFPENLMILIRVTPLCIGHRSRIKPDINQFRHPTHHTSAFGTRISNFIDIGPVQLQVRKIFAGFLG